MPPSGLAPAEQGLEDYRDKKKRISPCGLFVLAANHRSAGASPDGGVLNRDNYCFVIPSTIAMSSSVKPYRS